MLSWREHYWCIWGMRHLPNVYSDIYFMPCHAVGSKRWCFKSDILLLTSVVFSGYGRDIDPNKLPLASFCHWCYYRDNHFNLISDQQTVRLNEKVNVTAFVSENSAMERILLLNEVTFMYLSRNSCMHLWFSFSSFFVYDVVIFVGIWI